MRFSHVYFAIILCASLPAYADNEAHSRQEIFEMDKVAALASFNDSQQQSCIKAFNKRYQSRYSLTSKLAFDEPLSQGTYDQLFWKGQGNFHRGLIFTGSIADESGRKTGNLICYYATTDLRLDFQSAYVMPLPKKEKESLATMIQSSLITLSSNE